MTYPFFPTPPGIPPGTPPGGGGFGRAEEGDAGDGGAEAEGAGDAGAAGASDGSDAGSDASEAGAAGASDASDAGSDAGDAGAAGASSDDGPEASDESAESAESAEGGEGFVTETDFVTTESLGGGSGTPGSGGAAGEGYYEGGAPAPVQYSQTFRLTNNGGGNARIRSINFNTPEGIQHIADLTDMGSTSTFSEPLFTTSTIITTGTSKTFVVAYNFQYGGLGTRTGSIIIKGSGGIELRSNITLIISETSITAGSVGIVGGSGTGGGGSGGGYVPPAEAFPVGGGTSGGGTTPLQDQFSQGYIFYDIS